jgi:solute carrier family 25 carnitine/acylcarnitine transporter 20/29
MTQESNLSVVIKSLTAGTFAGMAQVFIGHPLDTVKTRLQTQDAANPRYKGGWDCFSKTLQQEGVRGLYKGMASPFFGAAFINAILFGAYGHFRHSAMQKNNTTDLSRVPIRDIFVAGGLAGLVNTVVAGPIELIKTKLQLQFNNPQQKALYAGPIDCAKKIYHVNGVPGLFKGMVPTILREIPAYASFYGVFEFMKRRLTPEGKSVKDLPLYSLMFAGSCGGIAYWCSCYPFDVIKSRIQGQSDMQPLYKGTLDCAQKIIKTEGYAGLFRGFAPAIVRTIPAAAATFTTFELAMQVLNK